MSIYKDFVLKVESLTQVINSVDFPSRLDKIDNTVSGMNIGIQNLQTDFKTIESNLSDVESVITEKVNSTQVFIESKLSVLEENLTKKHENNNSQIRSEFNSTRDEIRALKKNNMIFMIVIMALVIISVVLVYLKVYKV